MTEINFAERIARILMKLYRGEIITCAALVSEFGVHERTIYRDIGRLDGIIERLAGGRYQLAEDYRVELHKSALPRFAKLTGSAALLPDIRPEALIKLLRNETSASFQVRNASAEALLPNDPQFETLRTAIAEHRQCQLNYKDKARTLCPYRLIANKGIWYLAATENEQLKSFALSRIEVLQLTEQTFLPQAAIHVQLDAEDDIWLNSENIEVTLKIAAPMARYFQRRALLPKQEILETYPDGSLRVKSRARHLNQLFPIIRYWIPHIEIIEPTSLAEMLEKELRTYLEQMAKAKPS